MDTARRLVEESAVLVDGPWRHRNVTANGVRLHLVEAGQGPLVLMVHGFPQFWWCWRHQIPPVAAAGFRVVAVDLRGYGASDKPPRGYDAMTLAADLAGVVRALGERDAVVVGHDWGAHLGWAMAALHPGVVRRLVALSVPHPMVWLSALARDPAQRRASRYMARFQLPWHPERWLVDQDAAHVAELLAAWGGPAYPKPEEERRYRDAMQILYVPNRALEYYRWAGRSVLRADGRRFRAALRGRVTAPTLQLHGDRDRCVRLETARRSRDFAGPGDEWVVFDGVGHFPAEEAPGEVTAQILRWCRAA